MERLHCAPYSKHVVTYYRNRNANRQLTKGPRPLRADAAGHSRLLTADRDTGLLNMDTDDIYLSTAEQILTFGADKHDRTGTGTRSLFGQQMAFDISADKLPLLTTKELKLRSIIHELIWFLRGEGNIAYLKENKVGIWDEWADENGDL